MLNYQRVFFVCWLYVIVCQFPVVAQLAPLHTYCCRWGLRMRLLWNMDGMMLSMESFLMHMCLGCMHTLALVRSKSLGSQNSGLEIPGLFSSLLWCQFWFSNFACFLGPAQWGWWWCWWGCKATTLCWNQQAWGYMAVLQGWILGCIFDWISMPQL